MLRKKRRVAALLGMLVGMILTLFALDYYGKFVEQRAMDDSDPMSNPADPSERPVLTPTEQNEVNDLLRLAQIQLERISDQSNAEDIAYLLSFGPNNVVQLVESVLQKDPGHEAALGLRQQVFDVYLAKARALESENEYQQAWTLTRNAEEVIPNTGRARAALRRLKRSICAGAPAVCASR